MAGLMAGAAADAHSVRTAGVPLSYYGGDPRLEGMGDEEWAEANHLTLPADFYDTDYQDTDYQDTDYQDTDYQDTDYQDTDYYDVEDEG